MIPHFKILITAFLLFFVVGGYYYTANRTDNIVTLLSHSSLHKYPPPEVKYEFLADKSKSAGKERILITGGAGFIGSQLGYHLHTLGHQVTLLDNMKFGYDDNLIVNGERFGQFILGDVRDPNVLQFLEGIDIVFHFAALAALPVCQSNPLEAMDVNVAGVANILEGARKYNVKRFIFASTSAVYENNKESPLSEDLTVSPHLIYSLSKHQAELLVNAMGTMYDLDVVIMRFFNVYGPHQDFRRKSPPFTSYVIRELLNNRVPMLHSDGKQERDYVYITDLMALAMKVMTVPAAKGETFNVASGAKFSVNAMYDIIANALGSTIRPKYQSAEHFWDAYPELFEGSKPIKKEILIKEVNKVTVGTYSKAERVLGWKPQVTMKQGLEEMVKYVQKSQMRAMKSQKFTSAWKEGAKP